MDHADERDSRKLVYVSGAPGSGKSTLAVLLAAELGYPLLRKDRIKETLHDALGAPEPDRAWSRKLGAAAMELLWALAADAPAVVIEANFRPYSEYELEKIRGLAAQPVEVYCCCPPELAVEHYNARPTHPVHVVKSLTLAAMTEYDRPVGVSALVTVNTTAPVDVKALATQLSLERWQGQSLPPLQRRAVTWLEGLCDGGVLGGREEVGQELVTAVEMRIFDGVDFVNEVLTMATRP